MRDFFSPTRNRAALSRLFRGLAGDRRGVAAIEFAFVLPVMVTMYFGLTEVTQGVMIDRKVTQLNRTLADLSSQATTIDTTERDNIFNAATTVMAPYTTVAPVMSFTSIVIDASGAAKVCWSEAKNGGTTYATGASIAVPNDLKIAKTALIMAQSSYKFTPTIGHLITGTLEVGGDKIYMRPRKGKIGGTNSVEQVERSGKSLC